LSAMRETLQVALCLEALSGLERKSSDEPTQTEVIVHLKRSQPLD